MKKIVLMLMAMVVFGNVFAVQFYQNKKILNFGWSRSDLGYTIPFIVLDGVTSESGSAAVRPEFPTSLGFHADYYSTEQDRKSLSAMMATAIANGKTISVTIVGNQVYVYCVDNQ